MKEISWPVQALKARAFLAIGRKKVEDENARSQLAAALSKHLPYRFVTHDNMLEVMFSLRKDEREILGGLGRKRQIRIILGDDGEWESTQRARSMASGVYVESDLDEGYVEVKTSIVGLPPVFIYEGSFSIILTSDLYLLAEIPGLVLRLDPQGVKDMFDIGYPIERRTLFKDVKAGPAGYVIKLMKDKPLGVEKAWTLPKAEPLDDWREYIELQIKTFKNALRQIDLSSTILSLTSGLDTRAILSSLIETNRIIPAYTMCGTSLSLDAKIARDLSNAYGIRHQTVMVGEEFYRNLPTYVEKSCLLSGGITSLEQASEVYFYHKIDETALARLSGNLGNQVGRGGTEGVSMKNSDISILDKDFIKGYEAENADHWFKNGKIHGGYPTLEFLLQEEVPYSSVANYCIGNHFAIQKSPYATRRLIETHRYKPWEVDQAKSLSILRMRIKDIRHRFFGEEEGRSFQRRLIKDVGGYAALCPINWGWRANGGISLSGIILGSMAFLDAAASSKGLYSGGFGRILSEIGISELHEFRRVDFWFKVYLKEFVCDLLSSASTSANGLFDSNRLNKMLEEHFSSKKCNFQALSLALNLVLVNKIFGACP